VADAVRTGMAGRGDHAGANDAAASSVSPSAGSSAARTRSGQGCRDDPGTHEGIGWKGGRITCCARPRRRADEASSGRSSILGNLQDERCRVGRRQPREHRETFLRARDAQFGRLDGSWHAPLDESGTCTDARSTLCSVRSLSGCVGPRAALDPLRRLRSVNPPEVPPCLVRGHGLHRSETWVTLSWDVVHRLRAAKGSLKLRH
jgi:hypothetical protein